MLLLAIETSCDDTAAAVVRDGRDVLSSVATNQDEFHAKYGGIVPEIASRRHVALLSAAVEDALDAREPTLRDVDGIAVTAGPGLSAASSSASRPLKPTRLRCKSRCMPSTTFTDTSSHRFSIGPESPPYPFLTLLVSGGHSQLVAVESPTLMRILGRTHDDAAGEAYDKTARLLGLPYPGGPALDAMAQRGNPRAIAFPRHRPERAIRSTSRFRA